MIVVGAILVLSAFGLAYWSFKNGWEKPGQAAAGLAGAVVLLGAAVGILHLIGR